jgi:glycosyltransferase involved in cell wall biosynthesis
MKSGKAVVINYIDSLNLGGAETMAVNIANGIVNYNYESHLVCTREEGPLLLKVSPQCQVKCFGYKKTFHLKTISSLCKYILQNDVDIIHAHNHTIFLVAICKILLLLAYRKKVLVIWHDHSGLSHRLQRPTIPTYLILPFVNRIIIVDDHVAKWFASLGKNRDQIIYVPNFIVETDDSSCDNLPGVKGKRIVQVANIYEIKNQIDSVRALKKVVENYPEAHLLLVGKSYHPYFEILINEITSLNVRDKVSFLGFRLDVMSILKGCDIGILSSISEGTPLALLEYGKAGLPVVVTNVGQIEQMLENGRLGILVPPSHPDQLADGIIRLIRDPALGSSFSSLFQKKISKEFSQKVVLEKIDNIYKDILRSKLFLCSQSG